MKHHIERHLPGFGWIFAQQLARAGDYYAAVRELRAQFGQDTNYRLVQTTTIKATKVITNDYTEDDIIKG